MWINPYLGQRSRLFAEAAEAGYLVRRPDGTVWQSDLWVAGMALVDFTNPAAAEWFAGKVRGLLGRGADAIKADFGERVPTDVAWHDGSDPALMHNYYTLPLQPHRVRSNRGRAWTGPGGAVRPLGHRRGPALPGALGRRLRVDVLRDGRVVAAWSVAGPQRISGSGATTSAASRARPRRHCSSAGCCSACCRRTPDFTAPAPTACPGRSTTRPSRSPGASPAFATVSRPTCGTPPSKPTTEASR